MKLFYKHIKKGHLWVYWVAHNGFGLLPRLTINKVKHDILFRFCFTWYKLEAYLADKPKEHYYFVSFTALTQGVRKFGSAFYINKKENFTGRQFVKEMEECFKTDFGSLTVLYYREVSEEEYNANLDIYDSM